MSVTATPTGKADFPSGYERGATIPFAFFDQEDISSATEIEMIWHNPVTPYTFTLKKTTGDLVLTIGSFTQGGISGLVSEIQGQLSATQTAAMIEGDWQYDLAYDVPTSQRVIRISGMLRLNESPWGTS